MTNARALSCKCGTMHWQVASDAPGTHLACYCVDCQTAAQHFGSADMLDPQGGTEIFQTLPAHVTITQGVHRLALMRLSPKGLFRWYAACCGTPIANTLSSPKFSFCGIVLPADTQGFGPVTARVQTKDALAPVDEFGFKKTGFDLMKRALAARLTGKWRKTPFFDATGAPVAPPLVLSLAERDAARPS